MRLVWIALGTVAGILLAAALAETSTLVPLFWVGLLAVTVGIAWMRQHAPERWLWFAAVAFAFAGYRFAFVPQTSDIARYNEQNVTITGTIIAEPDIRDTRVQMQVAVTTVFDGRETHHSDGIVLVQAPRFVGVAYGDTVQATGRLATPAEFDTFSYADYLARSGVFSVMYNAIVERTATGGGSPIQRAILGIKHRAQQQIAQALPEPQAGLLTGILLGNERGLSPELSDDFARVGAAHIIAISGFNMVIVAGIVTGMLDSLLPGRRWLPVIMGLLVLTLYTVLVGANAAVVRAALMSALLVIAPKLQRKTYVPASLALVVIVMSLHQPLVLWDLSFQLSVFAVLGLALFTEPLTRWFDNLLAALFPAGWARQISGFLNEPLIVSLAALSLTLPLTIVYFQRVSLVSLLVNILIVPVQSYVLIVGGAATLLVILLPAASAIAQILFWLDMVLLSWSIAIVRWFADLPFADVTLILDTRLVLLFFIGIIGGAIMNATRPSWAVRFAAFLRRQPVWNALGFCGIGLLVLQAAMLFSRPDGKLHVWFLDAGHSNAVLLQTPGGAHILVDGGRFPSRLLTALGDRLPFYDREIELLFVTQPDEFDTGALPAVLARYDAGAVITNGQPSDMDAMQELQAAIAPYPQVDARAGYSVTTDDGVTIDVLHPLWSPENGSALNDGALVLRVTYGDASFLLAGDASISAQQAILERGGYPQATVLQLPQHGTARSLSDDFLAAVQPQAVVLQSDVANPRGDPSMATLAQLDMSIPLWRTDEQGTLHLWTDGDTLWMVGENK